jgi:BASS family bile acid:Na+ symporter
MIISQKFKSAVMPLALIAGIVCGCLAPEFIIKANKAIPYFIGVMLLISYSRLSPRNLRVSRMAIFMLLIQIVGSALLYLVLRRWDDLFAQQAFICLFCPVAISAPVIVTLLGSNISSLVSYTLLCYIATAAVAPFLLPFIGGTQGLSFFASSWMIAKQILPLILLPLIIVLLLGRFAPKINSVLQKNQSISFYLWSITLILVIGKSTTYVLAQPRSMIPVEIGLALISLIMCLIQFGTGHAIGVHYKEPESGTQGLGQKNIAIAMWMSFTYLNPLISIGLAAYSIWQNIINSTQIYLKSK